MASGISKKEAAKILGISTRGVERAVRRGKLSVRYERSRYGPRSVFEPSQVNAYSQEIAFGRSGNVRVSPFSGRAQNSPARSENSPKGFVMGTVTPVQNPGGDNGAAADSVRNQKVPVSEKLALNFAETVELSGLPRAFVANAIKQSRLKALKLGRSWFVKRADLDRFIEEL